MRTIETTAVVAADHTITVQLPDDIPPGRVDVVVVVASRNGVRPNPVFQPHPIGLTDPNCTFRREDLYGDGDR